MFHFSTDNLLFVMSSKSLLKELNCPLYILLHTYIYTDSQGSSGTTTGNVESYACAITKSSSDLSKVGLNVQLSTTSVNQGQGWFLKVMLTLNRNIHNLYSIWL